jgi:hypothetical protein
MPEEEAEEEEVCRVNEEEGESRLDVRDDDSARRGVAAVWAVVETIASASWTTADRSTEDEDESMSM